MEREQTDISWAPDATNLLHRDKIRAQTTVCCKDFVFDYCCNRHAIEAGVEDFPQSYVISPLAMVVESVDSIYSGDLMIAAQNEEILRVFDFVSKKKADRF